MTSRRVFQVRIRALLTDAQSQLHVRKAGAGRFDHLCGKLGCASGQAHGSDHGDDEARFEGWKGLLYLRAWESESGRIQYVRGWNRYLERLELGWKEFLGVLVVHRISINYKFSVNVGVENLCTLVEYRQGRAGPFGA